jgi:hypothetical protein
MENIYQGQIIDSCETKEQRGRSIICRRVRSLIASLREEPLRPSKKRFSLRRVAEETGNCIIERLIAPRVQFSYNLYSQLYKRFSSLPKDETD